MQRLRLLASKIMEIYDESHDFFQAFQQKTGLTCIPDCGECCLSTEVSASILEMIPTALDLYDQKLAEKVLDTLEQLNETSHCIFYIKLSEDGKKGRCSNYKHRPCVCRSFGAAAVKNKIGKNILSVCKEIKKQKSIDFDQITLDCAPIIGEFSNKILLMECSDNTKIKPINQALKQALMYVLSASAYIELTI
ncbi:MAG: hypothetical protein A2202_08970 [Bdellovibrionales bacterium RIFOXYA1_FULL_36_14]|nr:MAG: hypothetical protein A2202_08970 [Bdellovibrionales bacterium RIFOXYA1_FULL_36_14]